MLSVVIPIYNEERYIASCIDSVLAQDYPKDALEIILVDGMSTDGTRHIVQQYAARYPSIRLIDNPKRIAPCAMNIGIRASRGDIIVRLDAHVIFPNNYLSQLVTHLHDLHADNVGGLCRTLPASDTIVAQSIAAVLSSKFGMGNSHFRVGTSKVMEVDTVPFGCFHRDLFDRIGYFDEELIRNQDDEFNGRIIKHGGHIYLLPHLVVDYFARDKVSKVYAMFYQYGLFKPLVNKKLGSPATIRQFFPLCFVLMLLLGIPVVILLPFLLYPLLGVIGLYLLLSFLSSVSSSRHPLRVLCQMWIYFVVHFGYGWGYLVGLYKLLEGSYNVKANR